MARWRYIPVKKQEKTTADRQLAIKNKEILVNQTLITARRKFNKFIEDHDRYKFRVMNFNKIVKSKPFPTVMGIVNMWLKDGKSPDC
ncbi:MAG: hypothetical protein QG635_1921 [Bacteroidota bacterium]|nr:hypothetical protein [Bacteroidota bacterium]